MWQRYPVLIVLRLLRDCHRQGTGNPVVGMPSSPCQKRGDHVMSSGPMGETAEHLLPWICVKPYNRASGSRRWPSGQTKGEALSSPFLGILFLQGSMDLPSTNRKQNPNLGLIKKKKSTRWPTSFSGDPGQNTSSRKILRIHKQTGSGKRTCGTHLPPSTLGSCPLPSPQRGS